MKSRYGHFPNARLVPDPETGKRIWFQSVKVEHLPGVHPVCPLWVAELIAFLVGFLVVPAVVACCVPSLWRRFHAWMSRPTIWWIEIPQYRLLDQLVYITRSGERRVVPANFVFNGLSVPWWLWWLCPADHPRAFAGSAFHDLACTPPHPRDFKEAAAEFWAEMRANGMYPWGALRNWLAVRWFGPRF